MTSRFISFFEELFKNEGGLNTDPRDKGNYYKGILYGTIYGISAKAHFKEFLQIYNLYNQKLFELAKHQAQLFYWKNYWDSKYDRINDASLCFKIFDFGVNADVKPSIRYLQQVINKNYNCDIAEDGVFGEITLGLVNKFSPESKKGESESDLYNLYIKRLEKHYRDINSLWSLSGWLKRLQKIVNA